MTTQLPMIEAETTATYLGYADAGKSEPTEKAARAVERFRGRWGCVPAEVRCHPTDAAAIGPALPGGTRIVGDGHARNLFLVGPQPQELGDLV